MERAKVAVVDASVAVKWFLEEKYSREARLLLAAYKDGLLDLAAPSIMPYEVLNALKRSGVYGEDELKDAARALDDLQLTLHNLEGSLAEKTVEVAMRKGLTVYDAAYVALALTLNAPLYTADEELIRRARSPNVVHIAEFKV